MNFQGFGILNSKNRMKILGYRQDDEEDLGFCETRITQIKKESCLLFSMAAMSSSVILYIYDTKIYSEQLKELDKACQILTGHAKKHGLKHRPKLIFVRRDTPLEQMSTNTELKAINDKTLK